MQQVELLAPAGSPEAFYGAIKAGADAVYLAGTQYGARAYADNFPEDELLNCLKYAHLLGKKVYLTVNTLVKERELEMLPGFIKPYVEEGLDGVIVQDLGVLSLLSERFPKLPLHASTQMSITGTHGANLLKKMGVVRIVPARERSLEEIKKIKAETGMELECFIHGAMCYCFSGQCLFSSVLGGRSGNRGRCAQPCRLPYRVKDGQSMSKECYPLSLKDLCTIEMLPELIGAGIDSFKIEGRMKKPEYAAGVTAYYRKLLDAFYEGKTATPSKKDLEDLGRLYIRSERTNGYYYRANGKEMITLTSPAYAASDEKLLENIKAKYLSDKKRVPVRMEAKFLLGEPAMLKITLDGDVSKTVTGYGEIVEAAQKAPVTRENVIKQLKKLGDTFFTADESFNGGDPLIQMDDGIFLPLKSINELRRQVISELEEVIRHDK